MLFSNPQSAIRNSQFEIIPHALCSMPYAELEPQILWIMGLTDNRQQGNLAP